MSKPKQITAEELQELGGQQALGGHLLRKPIAGLPELGIAFGSGSLAPYTGYGPAMATGIGAVSGLKAGDALQKILLANKEKLLNTKGVLQTPAHIAEYLSRKGVRGAIGKALMAGAGAGLGIMLVPPDKDVKVIV